MDNILFSLDLDKSTVLHHYGSTVDSVLPGTIVNVQNVKVRFERMEMAHLIWSICDHADCIFKTDIAVTREEFESSVFRATQQLKSE